MSLSSIYLHCLSISISFNIVVSFSPLGSCKAFVKFIPMCFTFLYAVVNDMFLNFHFLTDVCCCIKMQLAFVSVFVARRPAKLLSLKMFCTFFSVFHIDIQVIYG